METNQNPAQEQPAQLIAPEVIQLEQQTAKPLYNPDEAARVVQILAHAYDPEYILLFGKLAGGTQRGYGLRSAHSHARHSLLRLAVGQTLFENGVSAQTPRNSLCQYLHRDTKHRGIPHRAVHVVCPF